MSNPEKQKEREKSK